MSMPPKPKLNVHKFPRPPLLEKPNRHLEIKWNGLTIADTKDAYWVLETTHPPTYYLPPTSVSPSFKLTPAPASSRTMCEWKGLATYWTISHTPSSPLSPDQALNVKNRIWSYETPTPSFTDIKGYLSFYAAGVPWECFVDGEKVDGQEGSFYGGWVTSDVEGPFKGGPGTWGW